MNNDQKLQLNKMLQENNVEDVTEDIREKKHSDLIKQDIGKLIDLKKKYARLKQTSETSYNNILSNQCRFLYDNYTDIFNRIKKDEINLEIMWAFLEVLKSIEENKIDQHEGAYEIGKLLKSIYVDSAIRKSKKIDEKFNKTKSKTKRNNKLKPKLTWIQYKKSLC